MHIKNIRIDKATLRAEQQRRMIEYNLGVHLMYIFTIVLYDKCDLSFKQIDNLYEKKMFPLEEKWREEEISTEELLRYAEKKKLHTVEFVRSIPMRHKLFLTEISKPIGNIGKVADSWLLSRLLFASVALKESYRFSNKKIQEFYNGIAWYMDLYYSIQPGTKEHYVNDEAIRQIFICEEHWDIQKAEKVG